MLITQKEAQLLDVLQKEVNRVLALVAERENIHRRGEGRITILFPGPMEQDQRVVVTLDSYLMSDFDIKTSWSKATLDKALLRAIGDVKLWYRLESDSAPSFPLDRLGIVE